MSQDPAQKARSDTSGRLGKKKIRPESSTSSLRDSSNMTRRLGTGVSDS